MSNNSILKSMKVALERAHATNNKKAISKDFAAGCGVSDDVFTSWVGWCNQLHRAITPWIEKFNNKDVTDEELKSIYDKVFPILKTMAQVSDKKLFIRESDVAYLCTKAHTEGASDNGSIDVLIGAIAFRRKVEFMFGNRLAQNEVLSEEEYSIITKYDSAVKNQAKAENRLNGYVNTKGVSVVGLKDKLKEAEDQVELVKKGMVATYKQFGAIPTDKDFENNEALAIAVAIVDSIKADIKSVEGQIVKSQETQTKYAKEYKTLMARIKPIK